MSNTTLAEENALKWLARLNSGSTTESEEQAFFRWLEASPQHQAAYIQAEILWQRGEVLAELQGTRKPRISRYAWFSACASLVLALAITYLYILQDTGIEQNTYTTGIGEQLTTPLADGSHVVINTQSTLQVEISNASRRALLNSGEVYFHVKADAQRPFYVETPSGTVRVLGTRFAVSVTGGETQVTVEEGRVALGKANEASFVTSVELTKNQKAKFVEQGIASVPESVNVRTALSWHKQQLIFEGEQLKGVIAELQRYWPQPIVVDGPSADLKITAVIQLSQRGFDVQQLASSLGLKVAQLPDGRLQLSQ